MIQKKRREIRGGKEWEEKKKSEERMKRK